MNYFEARVKFTRISDNGGEKKVSECYVIDAVSWTEAEARIIKEMEPYLNDAFLIDDIKRAKYQEIIENEDGDKYYRCSVSFISIDEEKGKEKRTVNRFLVKANNIEDANKNLKESLKEMMVDWDSTAIVETKIMDVYHYQTQEEDSEKQD